MKPGSIQCPRCGQRRVLTGRLVGFPQQSSRLLFQTQIALKDFLHRLLGKKLSIWVHEAPHLCVGCGLVWASVDPRLVQDEIQAHAGDDWNHALSRSQPSVMADRELDGPF